MTEDKFTELVNLYLDKEISESGLADLKAELAVNTRRKAEFRERCRLHQAMRLALNPQANQGRATSRRSGSSRSRRSSARCTSSPASRTPTSTRIDPYEGKHVTFPRWILGSGIAACLILSFVLLKPVFRDTTGVVSQPALKGVDASELVEEDPLDTISRAELRRFASIQEQRSSNRHASLAAQLRLMGLRPELTPEDKDLRSVSLAATQHQAPSRSNADLLNEMQRFTPMPTPRILSAESLGDESASRWPGDFKSSLASFK